MIMIIKHIADITWLATNDAWHAYDVIGVYKSITEMNGFIFHGAGNTVVGWYGHGRGQGP